MLRFTCNINCCKFAIFSRLYENLLLAKKTSANSSTVILTVTIVSCKMTLLNGDYSVIVKFQNFQLQ